MKFDAFYCPFAVSNCYYESNSWRYSPITCCNLPTEVLSTELQHLTDHRAFSRKLKTFVERAFTT